MMRRKRRARAKKRRTGSVAVVGKTVRRVDILHEPGEWMELRRLSWKESEGAKEAHTDAQLARAKSVGSEMLAAVRSVVDTEQAQTTQTASNIYDLGSVLRAGVVRWSYTEDLTPDNIGQLDDETAAWAFEQILALGKPRTEEEQKNDSSPSTSR